MKILNRSLVACLAGGWLLVTAGSGATVRDGDAALERFDLDAALAAYQAAHAADPNDYEAAWKLARAYSDKGTLTRNRAAEVQLFTQAETAARAAVRLKENDAAGHTYLAIAVGKRALFEGGKRQVELSKEVKEEAARAVQLNPREDLAYHVLGVWNREMVQLNWMLKKFAELLYGKFPAASLENAVTYLERAAELAPDRVAHHVELGNSYVAARKWQKADAAFARAISMPKSWVSDDYYKDQAKEKLTRVKRHLP